MRPGRTVLALSSSVLIALALLAPMVVLAAGSETVSDNFSSGDYSGGSAGWVGGWTEYGESGGTTSHSSGVIRITNSGCETSPCLTFATFLSVLSPIEIGRTLDIDGADSATLTFRYKSGATGIFEIWTRANSSDSWTKVLLSSLSYKTQTVDLTDDASTTTELRFRMSGLSVTWEAFVDDVVITATYPTTSTTASTTTTTTTLLPTTTSLPITTTTITLPVTTTTITIPSSGTTSTTSTTTTTLAGTSTTTSTTTPTSTGGTEPPGGGDPGEPPPENPQIPIDPLSPEEVELAAENNIAIDLADASDFQNFGIGINPLTGLTVGLLSTVETISSEIVSALLLGGAIAFFAVRRIKDHEDEPMDPRS